MNVTNLLLEIGTEEIPAGYIKPALKGLSSLILQRMDDARIEHGTARTFGTPRRLAVEVADVAGKQNPLTTEITGPPEKINRGRSCRKCFTLSWIGISELGYSGADVARYLGVTNSCITRMVLASEKPDIDDIDLEL